MGFSTVVAPFDFDEPNGNMDTSTIIPIHKHAQPTLDPSQFDLTVMANGNTQQTLAPTMQTTYPVPIADACSSSGDTKLTFLPTLVVTLYSTYSFHK
jgi:hypothetical protein